MREERLMHFLVEVIRDDTILHLLLESLDLSLLLLFVRLNKVKNYSTEKQYRYYLKVAFSIYAEKIKHHVLACNTIYDLVHMQTPLILRNVTLRKLLSVENESNHPQDLVTNIVLRLFRLKPFDRVGRKLINFFELVKATRVGLLSLFV